VIVYLIRHGLSAANVAQRVTGTPADDLVEAGRQQAESLGAWIRLAGVRPDAFLVSHWTRARSTAHALYPDASWVEDRRLGETDAGMAAELPIRKFLADWPSFYDSPANEYPNGESHLALSRRVGEFWADLCSREFRSACIVTHSGPISCILQRVVGIGMERFPAFLPAHASLSVLESEGGGGATTEFRLKGFSLLPQPGIFVR